jgi:hypothetical protein
LITEESQEEGGYTSSAAREKMKFQSVRHTKQNKAAIDIEHLRQFVNRKTYIKKKPKSDGETGRWKGYPRVSMAAGYALAE